MKYDIINTELNSKVLLRHPRKAMGEEFIDRCNAICGEARENCIIGHTNQIRCIADMVTNKAFGIHTFLEHASQKNKTILPADIELLMRTTQDMLDWVDYLRIANNLRSLRQASSAAQAGSEQRRETRFPLPPIYQNYITLQILHSDQAYRVFINNFSRNGVQLTSPVPVEKDASLKCHLQAAPPARKDVRFEVRVMYCNEVDEGYILGARVENVSDSKHFDFFRNIFSILKELNLK